MAIHPLAEAASLHIHFAAASGGGWKSWFGLLNEWTSASPGGFNLGAEVFLVNHWPRCGVCWWRRWRRSCIPTRCGSLNLDRARSFLGEREWAIQRRMIEQAFQAAQFTVYPAWLRRLTRCWSDWGRTPRASG